MADDSSSGWPRRHTGVRRVPTRRPGSSRTICVRRGFGTTPSSTSLPRAWPGRGLRQAGGFHPHPPCAAGHHAHSDFAIETVDGTAQEVRSRDGRSLPFDLLMIVPPHRPSQVLYDSGMVATPAGIDVDYDTLQTPWDGVFAIGDNANMPASKAGVVAHTEAELVAHNIAQA